MKLNRYLAGCLMILLSSACSKENEVEEALNFEVTASTKTVKVGEEVKFNIKGNAGTISFFSGEYGKDFTYRDQARIDAIDQITLAFSTHDQEAAPLPAKSATTLKVMFSTDFDGTYLYPSVNAATWTDITDKFTMASPALWGNNLGWFESGAAQIKSLVEPGKPFYIAFKFESPASTGTTVAGSRWRMSNFKLEATTDRGTKQTLGTYSATNFSLVSKEEPRTTASQLAGTILLFNPNVTPVKNIPIEEWGISKAYTASGVDVGNDKGVVVKAFGKADVNEHVYTYKVPGTYKAVFTAAKYGNKEVVQEFEITVLPNQEPVP